MRVQMISCRKSSSHLQSIIETAIFVPSILHEQTTAKARSKLVG